MFKTMWKRITKPPSEKLFFFGGEFYGYKDEDDLKQLRANLERQREIEQLKTRLTELFCDAAGWIDTPAAEDSAQDLRTVVDFLEQKNGRDKIMLEALHYAAAVIRMRNVLKLD